MKPQIFQRKYGQEFHTLYVFASKGKETRIVCECLANLYHKERETNSKCKHAQELLASLKANDLSKYKNFYSGKVLPYIMPKNRSVDIDEEIDFKLTELLIKEL